MRCPRCGHDTVITASEYVPADRDCLHPGSQLAREEVERDPVTPDEAGAAPMN